MDKPVTNKVEVQQIARRSKAQYELIIRYIETLRP